MKNHTIAYLRHLGIGTLFLFTLINTCLAQRNSPILDSLIQEAAIANNDSLKGELYKEIGFKFFFIDRDSCKFYTQKLLDFGERLKIPDFVGVGTKYNGMLVEMQGKLDEADSLFIIATNIFESTKDTSDLGRIYLDRGRICLRRNPPDNGKAYEMYTKSIDYAISCKDFSTAAKGEGMLGRTDRMQGKYAEAIVHYQKSIQIAQEAGDMKAAASGYDGLSQTYYYMEDIPKAIQTCQTSIDLFREAGSNDNLAGMLNNLGTMQMNLEKWEEAEKSIKEAIAIKEKLKIRNISGSYANLADIYVSQKKYDLAKQQIDKAKLYLPKGNTPMKQAILDSEVKILTKQKEFKRAKRVALEAYNLGKSRGDNRAVESAMTHIIGLEKELGDYKSALDWQSDYLVFKDSISEITNKAQINEFLTKYETAEKDREIALLAKDNELQSVRIQQQQRNLLFGLLGLIFFLGLVTFLFLQRQRLRQTKGELETSLAEKETLLKEIHHRVKNNLQLVTSLLNIQAEKESPQTIDEFLTQGQNRVKSMALIHEQLYRSDNISSIDIKEYAENLVKSIFEIHGNQSIIYKVQSDHTHLDIDQAIPLGLIINELVNNSLKHAFNTKDDGKLHVQMKQSVDQLEVIVKDDGDGFSSNNSKNSIGLQLVQILTKQLKGTFELHHQTGTTAKLVFPKA